MCLGVPGEVLSVDEDKGLRILKVKVGGVVRQVISALEDVKPGDYVIVHAGVAIGRINKEEAEETMRLLMEISSTQ